MNDNKQHLFGGLSAYKTVNLCRGRRCCPTMNISEIGVVLTDDYQGIVSLTHDEMLILIEEYHKNHNAFVAPEQLTGVENAQSRSA